jgi:hypothetical protein
VRGELFHLTLFDAGTLDTVAAIHLPDGFHGNWAPVD